MVIKPYVKDIDKDTLDNEDYRRVVFTGEHFQLVLMSILPGEDIGGEVHPSTVQFFRIEGGRGKAIIDGNEYEITEDYAITIPAGSEHNIINTGDEPLKLYSLYAPAEHEPGLVQPKKVTEKRSLPNFKNFVSQIK